MSDIATSTNAGAREPSALDRLRRWWVRHWGSLEGESRPLLNRRKMVLEPPRPSTFRITSVILAFVFAFFFLCAALVIWFGQNSPQAKYLTTAEKLMMELPSKQGLRRYLETYSSVAHLAGTEADARQAEWTRDQFMSFGLNDTKIETYWPLLTYPGYRRLAIVTGPDELRYEASLQEDAVDEDETSKNADTVPLFHGYSKNGTATGPVVYANYGRIEDFQYLIHRGINLTGTIALMRYGGSFRGLKVRAAERFGCVGALIYSDPADDGPVGKGEDAESYPNGPWRSASSAQRGSVMYLSLASGDPLTPGYAATENASRIPEEEAVGLPSIPSLPLSWKDALPLLRATQGLGAVGVHDWQGGLSEVDYFSGPSIGHVELINVMNSTITPIWNVVSRIEGAEHPDEAIILGNHRDAWVYGAADPSSGSAVMLELGRIFGHLLGTGWRPKRTILLASWDAEEFGLVGSTEWVEDHREWLDREAVAYINVDVAVTGSRFRAAASPSLSRLLFDVARLVPDPQNGKTVYDAWLSSDPSEDTTVPLVGQLGSGSDFVGFLDHLGIASADLGFSGDYGVYHSNYDSFHWMTKFGDPSFDYHATMTKMWGLVALRLADSALLPIHPKDYARELNTYVSRLSNYASFHFPTLQHSVDELVVAADAFDDHLESLKSKLQKYLGRDQRGKLPAKWNKRLKKANERLMRFERSFVDPEGIPGRNWFKHVVYAPGLWTGYSSQVFPAIVDAVDANDMAEARHAEFQAAECMTNATHLLQE